jgi:hypothetical protein
MSRPRDKYEPDARVRAVEMLVFLVVSAIGIYALGRGISGLSEPGKGIDLLWLAISAVTIWILVAQMGRVHDAWPRRGDSDGRLARPTTREEAETSAPLAPSGNEGDPRP